MEWFNDKGITGISGALDLLIQDCFERTGFNKS